MGISSVLPAIFAFAGKINQLLFVPQKCGGMEFTMNLKEAKEGIEYIISGIETDDEELDAFLFSLGCYSGEKITVVRHLKGGCIVAIKDGRYNIDNQLAEAIVI